MVKTFTLSFTLCLLLLSQLLWGQNGDIPASVPGLVVFKLKESSGSSSAGARTLSLSQSADDRATELSQALGAKKAYQAIPPPASPVSSRKRNGPLSRTSPKSPALSNIYKLELAEGQDVQEAIQYLLSSKQVEYAEPYYLPELLGVPDDEFIPKQTYLNAIKAFKAWDISQGSRDVIIGILDTGVDFDHPDLKENLHLNEADPVDGIDNDGDGYIDNYRGWDFANNDNDPSADKNSHGTVVSGFSSASTNNDIGIAGTGYKCRYMPIKIFRSDNNLFNNGYEAMVYAANMGCDVINLSWGAAGTRSQYVQDIINYIVLEKDVVVVAAAGNESKEANYYPASYDHVLSVSSSQVEDDTKSDYATWSKYVDVLAPGNNVYSTQNGGGYGTGTGTSFAAPQVAGAAGLVRSFFPELTAQQVMERIRVSSDTLSKVETNSIYTEKIGKGRLNMQKALDKIVSPAVRMQEFEIFNGTGPFAFYNDTLEIRMNFKNFLSPTTSLKAILSTNSSYVTILNDTVELNNIKTLETKKNESNPFRVYLHPDLPNNAVITFRIGYSDINYADYQHFELRTSGEFMDFKVDDLSLTIASNGNLGYNFDYNLNGKGFRFQNNSLAHNLGLVLATTEQAVANNMVETISPVVRNQDFKTLERLKLYKNSTAYRDARSVFESRDTTNTPLKLLVEQKVLGWQDSVSSSALVLEYRITNRDSSPYAQLFAGIFADFDIQEFSKNKASWDAGHQLGYAYNHLENRYAGVALLNDGMELSFHALDIASRNGNTTEIQDTITRAQKFGYVSNGIVKSTAGVLGSGNDVAQFLSAKMPDLAPNESRKVAYTLVTATTLEGLQKAVETAKERYLTYLQNPPILSTIIACPGTNINIQFPEGETYEFYGDPFGQHLLAKGSSFDLGEVSEDVTIYAANASQAWLGDIGQIKIEIKTPVAAFSMSADTLSINPGETGILQLTDSSEFPAEWLWDFQNGYKSTKQSPKAFFNKAGTYTINLQMSNVAHCKDSTSKQLVVVNKNTPPLLSNQLLCSTGTATLQTENGEVFTLYADADKSKKIYSGSQYTTELLSETITYFATSGTGSYESDLLPVQIEVTDSGVDFTYQVDSTSTDLFALQFKASIKDPEKAGRIDWFINGSLAGSGNPLVWPYNPGDEKVHAQAIVYYQNGCQSNSSKEIVLLPAPKPVISTLRLCKGSEARIRPVEEGIYYFYADEEKLNLLNKGREYVMASCSESTTFYVTNLSLGQESDTVQVQVMVRDNMAAFSPISDTILVASNIHFSSLFPEATNHYWDFGNGLSSTLAESEHLFTEAGNYTVSLSVQSPEGCKETHSRTFVVISPTALNNGGTANPTPVKLYPNPAQTYVRVELPALHQPYALLIKDLRGRIIQTGEIRLNQKTLDLDISTLIPGWYLLQIQDKKNIYSAKLLKE